MLRSAARPALTSRARVAPGLCSPRQAARRSSLPGRRAAPQDPVGTPARPRMLPDLPLFLLLLLLGKSPRPGVTARRPAPSRRPPPPASSGPSSLGPPDFPTPSVPPTDGEGDLSTRSRTSFRLHYLSLPINYPEVSAGPPSGVAQVKKTCDSLCCPLSIPL